ncbi:hypothetical protein D3C84_794350 [compost metagenome]
MQRIGEACAGGVKIIGARTFEAEMGLNLTRDWCGRQVRRVGGDNDEPDVIECARVSIEQILHSSYT